MVNIPVEKLSFRARSFRKNVVISDSKKIYEVSVANESNGLKFYMIETPPGVEDIPEDDVLEVLIWP